MTDMAFELQAARRARLGEILGTRAALVLFSPPERLRNGDVHHKFRQDSDILYLTGFEEPGTVVVLRPGHAEASFVMFVRPRNPSEETWTGRRAGVDGALNSYGASVAYSVDELDVRLPDVIGGVDELHYHIGRDPEVDERLTRLLATLRSRERRGPHAPLKIVDARLAALAATKPGTTLDAIHADVVAALTRKMVELGLLVGDVPQLIESGAYKTYYMHRTSHWLGMDVHDVGFYSLEGAARKLEPGMVLTIEPGLYIAPDEAKAPTEYRGICGRIDD